MGAKCLVLRSDSTDPSPFFCVRKFRGEGVSPERSKGTPGGFAPGVNSAAQPGYMRHAHKGVVCLATCPALQSGGGPNI